MNLLYESDYFKCYQCDSRRCFFLAFEEKTIQMTCCQLLAFRTKVSRIDLSSHFNGENHSGLEILSLCNREHLLILDTHQLIDLKQLVKVTFGMFELNGLV